MTFSIDIQHNSKECHYAECRDYLNVMLSVVMLDVVMLNVIMLSVVVPGRRENWFGKGIGARVQ